MKKQIIVRADGNSKIGIGHIARCIYFLENIKKKHEAVFCFTENSLIKEFLISRKYSSHEIDPKLSLDQEIDKLLDFSSGFVILDVRNKPNEYHKSYSENFDNVLRFDDSSEPINLYANQYLNYNLYAKDVKFNLKNNKCKLYLGPKYYILNPSFKKYVDFKRLFEKKGSKSY